MNKQQKQWLASLTQTATPTMQEALQYLGSELAWLHELAVTPQDPEWHAEGNVLIHTDMLLSELYQLLQTQATHIQGERRQALILGAMLHDIAKPKQTRVAEVQGIERIISPQHEAVGRSYLAFKMLEWGLSFASYWTVLNLVGEHHMPKLLVAKDKPAAAYYRLARQADMELLYWLEVADMRGRICADTELQLLYLDEFRTLAQQYGVWQQPLDMQALLAEHLRSLPRQAQTYVYASALYQLEQGLIYQAEEALATTYAHRTQHAHLVMVCGVSGSGKSTWLQQHYPDYEVVSLDDLREALNGDRADQAQVGQIRQATKEQLKAALRQKRGVVWDATNLRVDFRHAITELGRDYHALVTLVLFLLPEAQIEAQNRARSHAIPTAVLAKQLASFQFPSLEEAHHFIVVGTGGRVLWQSGIDTEVLPCTL